MDAFCKNGHGDVEIRQYKNKNYTYCKVCIREYYREHYNIVRKEVLGHYGYNGIPICVCCGETEIKFLTLDHINNNGAEEMRKLNKRGGKQFYSYLRKRGYPSGYQTLCYNCNCSKGNYGCCPHQMPDISKYQIPVGQVTSG